MDEIDLIAEAKPWIVGFPALCGMEIEELTKGACTASVRLRPELLNAHGFAHGGVIHMLMDTAAGVAGRYCYYPQRPTVTRSADVHFLRPVQGAKMTARAAAVKIGRTGSLMRAELFDEQERLCATGYFEMIYMDATRKNKEATK